MASNCKQNCHKIDDNSRVGHTCKKIHRNSFHKNHFFAFLWMSSLSVHKFLQTMKCQSNSISNPLPLSEHEVMKLINNRWTQRSLVTPSLNEQLWTVIILLHNSWRSTLLFDNKLNQVTIMWSCFARGNFYALNVKADLV